METPAALYFFPLHFSCFFAAGASPFEIKILVSFARAAVKLVIWRVKEAILYINDTAALTSIDHMITHTRTLLLTPHCT